MSSDYIVNMFDETLFSSLKPEKIRVGIFTNNILKCNTIFEELKTQNKDNIKLYINSRDHKELMLNDDTNYIWVKPYRSSCGYRCSKAYIDKNVTLSELQYIIRPICIYCTRKDITII